MRHLPFGSVHEVTLTGKAKEIYDKFEEAKKLPNWIKVSFWGRDPMVSPRAAKLLSDPETRALLLRATRGDRRTD